MSRAFCSVLLMVVKKWRLNSSAVFFFWHQKPKHGFILWSDCSDVFIVQKSPSGFDYRLLLFSMLNRFQTRLLPTSCSFIYFSFFCLWASDLVSDSSSLEWGVRHQPVAERSETTQWCPGLFIALWGHNKCLLWGLGSFVCFSFLERDISVLHNSYGDWIKSVPKLETEEAEY